MDGQTDRQTKGFAEAYTAVEKLALRSAVKVMTHWKVFVRKLFSKENFPVSHDFTLRATVKSVRRNV